MVNNKQKQTRTNVLVQFSTTIWIVSIPGAFLILAGRDADKLKRVQQRLITSTGNSQITIRHLELKSLSSVAAFAQQINADAQPIYALVNNAGIFYAPPALTEDRLEATFQTNFVAPFLLTLLLLPSLRASPDGARIVNLSSKAHLAATDLPNPQFYQPFEDTTTNRFTAYQLSKFYLVLFAYRLHVILEPSSGVSVHCVDPGNVETGIYRSFPPLADPLWFALQKPIRVFCVKTPLEGSQGVLHTLVRRATPPFYLEHLNESRAFHYRTVDPCLSEALWRATRRMCQPHMTESNRSS